jgi:hypothetical protein
MLYRNELLQLRFAMPDKLDDVVGALCVTRMNMQEYGDDAELCGATGKVCTILHAFIACC